MSIGENIKKWRELRNLKQSELADLVDVSDKTVSSWEINRTEPKMGMIEKICKALNCKKTDIIGADSEADSEADSLNATILQPDIILTFPDGSQVIVEMKRTKRFQEERFARLLKYYSLLNEIGQKKALDNLEDLTKIYFTKQTTQSVSNCIQTSMVAKQSDLYKSDTHLVPDAAHARTDLSLDEHTEELKQQEDDIMNDENF